MEKNNCQDVAAFIKRATENIITTNINGKLCTMNAFFSVNRMEQFFSIYEKSKDYRLAFSRTAYQMFKSTDLPPDGWVLSEDDFIQASDIELSAIISAILGEDGTTKEEFGKIACENIFERFYLAHKNIVDGSFSKLKKIVYGQHEKITQMFSPALLSIAEQANRITESIQRPIISAKIIDSLSYASAFHLPQMDSGFANIVAQQAELTRLITPPAIEGITNLQAALQPIAESSARIMAAVNYSGLSAALSAMSDVWQYQYDHFNMTAGMQSLIDSIPKFSFDFAKITASLVEPLRNLNSLFADSLRSPIEMLEKSISNIDFSMLTYHRKWNERHDALLAFGWFYLNELPDELIDDIYQRQEELSKDNVNAIIIAYFRNERCAAVKRIVKKWRTSRYFAPRNTVFHEAIVNHSRRCFNTSVTLLTLHTEGVITDFVRLAFKNPKYHAEKALTDIHKYMNDMPYAALTFSDWQIFDSVVAEIQAVLTEGFDLANPDAASNNLRHKIAHGHAVEKETEAASLKRFLYLNELYRIFSVIDEELAFVQSAEDNTSVSGK